MPAPFSSQPAVQTSNTSLTNNNVNVVYNKYSRYVGGGTTEVSQGYTEWWERAIFPKDPTDTVYIVENFYVGRLDLIASVFYNQPLYGWVIGQYNNILDPFTEIKAGTILLIPSSSRLSIMLNTKQGGVPSTKEAVSLIQPIIS
jgi:hypothetical protein